MARFVTTISDAAKAMAAKALAAGVPVRTVAAEFGMSATTAKRIRAGIGLVGHRGRYSWGEVQRVYDAGLSKGDLVERFRITKSSLQRAVAAGRFRLRQEDRNIRRSAEQYAKSQIGNKGARGKIRAKILEDDALPYVCAECGIDTWRQRPLTLRLDHVNGDPGDHRMENMRFLCPNCDSQQDTYCYRNVKR